MNPKNAKALLGDNSLNVKRRWYFYISDKGINEISKDLMSYRTIRFSSTLGVVIAFLWLLDVVRQPFAPTDWVEATVWNVPKNLNQIYLIAEDRDGVRALNWYFSMITVWTGDPRHIGENWHLFQPDTQRFGELQWPVAARYGALAQRADGTWEMWWLEPSDMECPSISRYLVGGGTAEIWLPDESRAVAPSEELLKQIGLHNKPAGL